jgi:hypothetical protein
MNQKLTELLKILNLYQYAGNNPLNKKDPLGLHNQPPPCGGSVGGTIAATIAIVGIGALTTVLSGGLIALDIYLAIHFGITDIMLTSLGGIFGIYGGVKTIEIGFNNPC